jgi:hypothetical protein
MALDGQQHVGEPAENVGPNGLALVGPDMLNLVGRDAEMIDQNQTSRSTNPISAPRAASVRTRACQDRSAPGSNGFAAIFAAIALASCPLPSIMEARPTSVVVCFLLRFRGDDCFCRFALASLTVRKLNSKATRLPPAGCRRPLEFGDQRPRGSVSIAAIDPGRGPIPNRWRPVLLQPLRNGS